MNINLVQILLFSNALTIGCIFGWSFAKWVHNKKTTKDIIDYQKVWNEA